MHFIYIKIINFKLCRANLAQKMIPESKTIKVHFYNSLTIFSLNPRNKWDES